MPRNRKTKGRGTSGVHAKAVVPDGDEGQQLESELKAEKIKTMISDFDMEGIECIFLSGFIFMFQTLTVFNAVILFHF